MTINRRELLATGAAFGSALAIGKTSLADSSAELLQGKAEHVISIWLGGGMGQIDTFDPKRKGDPAAKTAGSYYESIDTDSCANT